MVKIRRAKLDDLFELADMWEALQKETPVYPLESDGRERERFIVLTVSRIYDPAWFILLAEMNEKTAGFIIGVIRTVDYSSDSAGLCDSWYVKPEFRLTKVGPKLADDLFDRVTSVGECKFLEMVTPNEPRLIRRWEKKGWTLKRVGYIKEVKK